MSQQHKKSHQQNKHQKAGRISLSNAVRRGTQGVFKVFHGVTDVAKDVGHMGLEGIESLGRTTSRLGHQATRFGQRSVEETVNAVKALGQETSRGVKGITRRLSPNSMRSMRSSMRRRAQRGGSQEKKQLSLNSAVKLLRNYYSSKYNH